MLADLLGGFIVIAVGVSLVKPVADAATGAVLKCNDSTTCLGANSTYPTNVTGPAAAIVPLITLFFCLGIMAIGVSIAVRGLKNAGAF